ncbi:MAG: F0F1 ATP synthase subunit C [Gemmatimonadota bacterium]|jgi:F-type H+-transporting ATPase subunit c
MLRILALVQDVGDAAAAAGTDVGAGFAVIGGGLAVIGAGLGIGLIGGNMTQAMARQPESAAQIQNGAIILAALIEGAALFGLVIAGFVK